MGEAGDIIAADPLSMASGELIDAIDGDEEAHEAEAASTGTEGLGSEFIADPKKTDRLKHAHIDALTSVAELLIHIAKEFVEEEEEPRGAPSAEAPAEEKPAEAQQ